jgi:hypothetical protein
MGTKSGRADLVDKNTGEFWEIKSDYSGTGLAQGLFDVKGYAMSGNTYGPKGLQGLPLWLAVQFLDHRLFTKVVLRIILLLTTILHLV